jgi:hypothetical protein
MVESGGGAGYRRARVARSPVPARQSVARLSRAFRDPTTTLRRPTSASEFERLAAKSCMAANGRSQPSGRLGAERNSPHGRLKSHR